MSEHTPGPWKLNDRGEIHGVGAIHFYGNRQQIQANKRLIAQAPDLFSEIERLTAINAELLEACQAAMRISDCWLPSDFENIEPHHESELEALGTMYMTFKAAIAKAKPPTDDDLLEFQKRPDRPQGKDD